jgi:hypothetical protein
MRDGLLPQERVRAIQEELAGFIDAEVLQVNGEYYSPPINFNVWSVKEMYMCVWNSCLHFVCVFDNARHCWTMIDVCVIYIVVPLCNCAFTNKLIKYKIQIEKCIKQINMLKIWNNTGS